MESTWNVYENFKESLWTLVGTYSVQKKRLAKLSAQKPTSNRVRRGFTIYMEFIDRIFKESLWKLVGTYLAS